MEFSVPKMSCGHCTAAIEKAVRNIDPVANVECDLETRRVTVDTSLSRADVGAAIKQAGYDWEQIVA